MRRNAILWLAPLVGACIISGCGNLEEHQTLDRYYGGNTPVREESVPPGALRDFIVDVARGHATLENTLNGQPVRGIFLTDNGHCQQVAMLMIDQASRSAASADTYEVCGGRIQNITLTEPLPSYPDSPEARAALASAREAARLYGQQTVHYQRYEIITRAIGITDRHSCPPVETVITYHANLVFHDIQEQCHPVNSDSGRK